MCVVTQFTPEIYHYAHISTVNHRSYAARHGYNYRGFSSRLTDEFNIPDNGNPLHRDGIYWQAFAALRQVLEEERSVGENDRCAWLMWVDADVIFTDLDRPVTAVLADAARQGGFDLAAKDVIMSREQWQQGPLINAGVFLLRSNDAGRQFVQAVIDKFRSFGGSSYPEQNAMHAWAFDRDNGWLSADYEASARLLRGNVAVLPQRAMNAFHGWNYSVRDESTRPQWEWKQGDFIAHFVGPKGSGETERFALMRKTAEDAEARSWGEHE